MRCVMISLDAVSGVDADRLFALPALCALKARGASCVNVRTVYPTLTYPIHASLLTGCYPDSHGVPHNNPFQPDTPPAMRTWYWEEKDIKRKTLHQAAREKRMRVASILWPVTGKSSAIGRNFPEILPLPGENATLKMLRYASPVWLMRMELKYGKTRKSIKQPDLDDYATLLCEKLIFSRHPPDLLTVHLVDCDAMRHRYGVDSRQARDAMKRLDARVGRIVAAVDKRGLYDDTLFCVVSDHGQEDAPRAVPLDILLKEACGARAQTLGMGAYIFGDTDVARAALEKHKDEWAIGHIYTEDELRALRAPKQVTLAVDATNGACFTDKVGETTRGEHGFSLERPTARTLFVLVGGRVKRGAIIESMDLIDIAPTLAFALGLSLPDAEGRALKEIFDGRNA